MLVTILILQIAQSIVTAILLKAVVNKMENIDLSIGIMDKTLPDDILIDELRNRGCKGKLIMSKEVEL